MTQSTRPALTWADFIDHLADVRNQHGARLPLRAMSAEIASRLVGLLFPQLSSELQLNRDVAGEAEQVERLLVESVDYVAHGQAQHVVPRFLDKLPQVREALLEDAEAIHAGDPAAESVDEVVLAYPGFLAIAVHRMAHELYSLEVPVLPRVLSEWAHGQTGIDIHPGASIGAAFAIDHGTGVVIGETTVIGNHVRLYQGVTLGALAVSKRYANSKRHPTIGNDVVIYANATILGGTTHVGDGSIIGGNVWLTSSVPPRSVVQFSSRVEQRSPGFDDGLEFHI